MIEVDFKWCYTPCDKFSGSLVQVADLRKSLFEETNIAVRMLEVRFWTRKGVAREAQVP